MNAAFLFSIAVPLISTFSIFAPLVIDQEIEAVINGKPGKVELVIEQLIGEEAEGFDLRIENLQVVFAVFPKDKKVRNYTLDITDDLRKIYAERELQPNQKLQIKITPFADSSVGIAGHQPPVKATRIFVRVKKQTPIQAPQ
jgi:hypothetical protein